MDCTLLQLLLLISLYFLFEINATSVDRPWLQPSYSFNYWNNPLWHHLDPSAFKVENINGVDHVTPSKNVEHDKKFEVLDEASPLELLTFFQKHYEQTKPNFQSLFNKENDVLNDSENMQNIIIKTLQFEDVANFGKENENASMEEMIPRVRRDADNETMKDQIITSKNVREVRQRSPESWISRPLSVGFSIRNILDHSTQQTLEDELPGVKNYREPKADFITNHHRNNYGHRDGRVIPLSKGYDSYDFPWYRNSLRDRDYYTLPQYRGYNYYYPERYSPDRKDYYNMRLPNDYFNYYDRNEDEPLDFYSQSRSAPKPKRIIYYATLPEIVRKPIDMRNYPKPYDRNRSQVSRNGSLKRIPEDVNPTRFQYRSINDGYDSYLRRSNFLDKPGRYSEMNDKKNKDMFESFQSCENTNKNNEKKLQYQNLPQNEEKSPWSVQVGTEVSVKSDERAPGGKVFEENNGFERFQNAQIQETPAATGPSEIENNK